MNIIDRPNPVLNPTFTPQDLAAAMEIVRDLDDRKGLKNVWDTIDEDVRTEIIETWAQIIHDNSYSPPSAD